MEFVVIYSIIAFLTFNALLYIAYIAGWPLTNETMNKCFLAGIFWFIPVGFAIYFNIKYYTRVSN